MAGAGGVQQGARRTQFQGNALQMGGPALLGGLHVIQEGGQRAQGRRMGVEPDALQVLPAEEGQHLLPGPGGLETPGG